jgi:hypothetical protein
MAGPDLDAAIVEFNQFESPPWPRALPDTSVHLQ